MLCSIPFKRNFFSSSIYHGPLVIANFKTFMTSQYCKLLTIGSYFLSIIIQNIPFGLVRSSSDGIGKIKMERFVLVCDN